MAGRLLHLGAFSRPAGHQHGGRTADDSTCHHPPRPVRSSDSLALAAPWLVHRSPPVVADHGANLGIFRAEGERGEAADERREASLLAAGMVGDERSVSSPEAHTWAAGTASAVSWATSPLANPKMRNAAIRPSVQS